MTVTPTRGIRTFRYAVFFDGVDDYAVISPFTVYNWSEITIQEWIYFYHPKVNALWSKTSTIGDPWVDYPAIQYCTNNRVDYTALGIDFFTRTPAGTRGYYGTSIYVYRNAWINVVRRFTSTREFSAWVNASRVYAVTVPADEKTVLEWNPDNATYPERYKRFVLGSNINFGEQMKMMQSNLLIYSKAPPESELRHNMTYPWNPVRDGLKVWLLAHPDYVKDIDGDGILEWIDLSGNGNHAKLYGARLVELIKTPSRILTPIRVAPVVR